MLKKDEYKSLSQPSKEVLFKDKGDKFFGYALPVQNETEIENALEQLKTQHHKARHFCYAWQLGKTYDTYKANDDGEPNNSAGMPIFGQLQSFEITNCLVVVVRYFGGTKLGVGGLISAYKTTAKMALENANIQTHTIDTSLQVTCEYDMMNEVMRLVKELNLNIIEQDLKIRCKFIISIRQQDFNKVKSRFEQVYGLELKTLE
ncbi:YigZ family protein [Flavobacterium sp. CS20]|uniref:IMPACT family protein n=1 Tax=Flavobacterium sp. CS20 TaxID=2775246 RepID=UPI001B3A5CF3|nr:YigZ family protein [Flavobacterium sp. CS20]QTY26172.1 YigZ family protein [Flavobacterium sp. CS20]